MNNIAKQDASRARQSKSSIKFLPTTFKPFPGPRFSSTEVEISIFKKVTLYGKFAIPSLEFLSGHPLPHPPRSEVETHRVDVLKVGGGVPVRQEVDLRKKISSFSSPLFLLRRGVSCWLEKLPDFLN